MPIVVLAVQFAAFRFTLAAVPMLIAGGIFFLLLNFVRSQGLKAERQLVKIWDGFPTTHMLRYRDAESAALFDRRRGKIEAIYGQHLPSAQLERDDPIEADQIYAAAVRSLIGRVNEDRA
jgi:hypothetical protein